MLLLDRLWLPSRSPDWKLPSSSHICSDRSRDAARLDAKRFRPVSRAHSEGKVRGNHLPRSSSNVTTSRSSCCAVSVTGQCATPRPRHHRQRGFTQSRDAAALPAKTSVGHQQMGNTGRPRYQSQPQQASTAGCGSHSGDTCASNHYAACRPSTVKRADASTL